MTATSPASLPAGASGARAVLATADPTLALEVQRLAAAAGATVDAVPSASMARSRWASAVVVLVGADVAAELAELRLPRRDRVHVLGVGGTSDGIFRSALALGAESVVELPEAAEWLTEALADTADDPLESSTVVGVMGGCGGAGATTFAVALALTAAATGAPVTLVDADPLGAGVERLLSLEADGAVWGSLTDSFGRLGSRSLRSSLPRTGDLAVLGWGGAERRTPGREVVAEVVDAACRGSAVVVVDLPRYPDAASAELLLRCDHLVVVTPLAAAAVAATSRCLATVVTVPRVHLVTRGSSWLDPEEVADAFGVPLLVAMADQRRLEDSVDAGLGPLAVRRGPLARAARAAVDALGLAPVPARRRGGVR